MKTCLCGCGEPVAPNRTYRRGHIARTTAFKAAVFAPRRSTIPPPNPSGLCMCGCGRPTPISGTTNANRGVLRGHPTKYVHGHSPNAVSKGADRHTWKGGRTIRRGYVMLHLPDHPKADKAGYVSEHRVVWEQVHGELPAGQHIHHINGIRGDNRPENLIALSASEHKKEHGSPSVALYHAEHPGHAAAIGRKGAEARWGKTPKEPRPCAFCGEMFKPDNHGTECCSQSHAQRLRHQRTPRPVKPSRRCPVCGTEFTPKKKPDQKYCQLACYRVVMRGEVLQPSFDFG